jgi:hypothetical protein
MNKTKIKAFAVAALLMVCSGLLFTNASSPTYNFLDFLPLDQSVTGVFTTADGKALSRWVINPGFGTTLDTKTQIQFRHPDSPDQWLSDIWEYNRTGPFGWKWAYLISQGERKKDPVTGKYIDSEYKIKSKKTEILRYVGGQEYKSVFDYTDTAGKEGGIPYARMSWDNYKGVGLRYIVKNSYIIENASGDLAFLVYHEQEFIHNVGEVIEGPGWSGPAPKSREYILLSENYWQFYVRDPNYYQNNPDKNPWIIGGLHSTDGNPAVMEILEAAGGKYAWPSSNSVALYGRTRHHAKKTETETGIMGFRVDTKMKDGLPLVFGTASVFNYLQK